MSLFAHFPIFSYQPRTPLGQSINEYTAHLGKLYRSVFAFMRGSRGGVGGPDLLENRMLRTKNEELFSDSRAWTPSPLAKNSLIRAWLCTRYLYAYKRTVCFKCVDAPADLSPESSLLHIMKCHSLAYFFIKS